MSEDFVRKDIHDLEVRRLDRRIDEAVLRIEARNEAALARIDVALAEIKAENAVFRERVSRGLVGLEGEISCVKDEIFKTKSEIGTLRSEVQNISRNVSFSMTIFGLLILMASIAIQVWK